MKIWQGSRLCVLCNKGEVESEQHTMMRSTFYANEQADLFALETQQNNMFLSLNEQEQFIFLMSLSNVFIQLESAIIYLYKVCVLIKNKLQMYSL